MIPISIWDNPDLKTAGDFIKLDAVGDSCSGVIQAIRAHKWDDGKVDPQIMLTTDDGQEKSLTAGQIRLKALLTEQRPEAGDHITVTLVDIEKRAGGKTLKHFELVTKRAGDPTIPKPGTAAPASNGWTEPVAQPPAPPVAVAGGAQTADPAAVAAALAALTPDQRAAMGLPAA